MRSARPYSTTQSGRPAEKNSLLHHACAESENDEVVELERASKRRERERTESRERRSPGGLGGSDLKRLPGPLF
jgi:hypothetical protein